MQPKDINRWKHQHNFVGDRSAAERSTRRVIVLTAAMMVAEIVAGLVYNSMALLADGWHMGTHVGAFVITACAYALARRFASDTRFNFGTGKISVLGGFASAVVLAVVAVLMAGESVKRFLTPAPIRYTQAIVVAIIGLAVNLTCAFLLRGHHQHDHEGHPHRDDHDLNLRAAYLHVLADAMTSVLAITALVGGKMFGWAWLDPAMGIVGGVLVARWAYGLLRETSGILLDQEPVSDLATELRRTIEADGDSVISDLHIWRVGEERFAAIISVVADDPKSPDHYKQLLRKHQELVHITVEVNRASSREALT